MPIAIAGQGSSILQPGVFGIFKLSLSKQNITKVEDG